MKAAYHSLFIHENYLKNHYYLLDRVWRKGGTLTFLVVMYIGTATMENSVEIALKAGNMA